MQRMMRIVCFLGFGLALLVSAAPTDATAGDVAVVVAPKTLLLSELQGGEITVHATIAYSQVDCATLTLNGIPVTWTKADSRGELVAKFDEAAVKAIVSAPSAVLTLKGATVDGEAFEGSATVRVVS